MVFHSMFPAFDAAQHTDADHVDGDRHSKQQHRPEQRVNRPYGRNICGAFTDNSRHAWKKVPYLELAPDLPRAKVS